MLKHARIALEGLSVADALGGFFEFSNLAKARSRQIPTTTPWHYTDDTNMALSIYEILRKHGEINQDALAQSFADHYDRLRGYGMGARTLINRIKRGEHWRDVSHAMFNGSGSYGNGGAMRIAPLGAYFADDLDVLVDNARKSVEITHAHEEGIAGGIAVAVATAFAYRLRDQSPTRRELIDAMLPYIPASEVKQKCVEARDLPDNTTVSEAVAVLGNGTRVSAQDTVPFVLWSAGENLTDYENAFWQTACAGGDVDTTCAMVGGILGAHGTPIPETWIANREPLPKWALGE